MSEYDYKEEANKLRAKRNFAGLKLKLTLPMSDYYEKKISEQCKTLKEYKEAINEILDELENKTFKDEVDLETSYYTEIEMYGHFGIAWECYTSVSH